MENVALDGPLGKANATPGRYVSVQAFFYANGNSQIMVTANSSHF